LASLRRNSVRQRAFEYWCNIDEVVGGRIEVAVKKKLES
jgi:hypothetical protein